MSSGAKATPWGRIFIEGLVIVGSILLAFSIDAWWEKRDTRQDLTGLAELLRADSSEEIDAISDPSGAALAVAEGSPVWDRIPESIRVDLAEY